MDLSLADGIYPALVVALAYVVLGLTGFASSLIAVPLLAAVLVGWLVWRAARLLARRGFDIPANRKNPD